MGWKLKNLKTTNSEHVKFKAYVPNLAPFIILSGTQENIFLKLSPCWCHVESLSVLILLKKPWAKLVNSSRESYFEAEKIKFLFINKTSYRT